MVLLAAAAWLLSRRSGAAPDTVPALAVPGSLRVRLLEIGRLEAAGGSSAQRLAELSSVRDPIASLAAASALLRLDPRRALELLGPTIARRDDWPVARLGTVFEKLGPAAVTPALVQWLVARPQQGLVRVARLARFGHRHRVAVLVRGWLTGNDTPEVIMAALEYVEEDADLPWVQSTARHEDWRVRMAAARALARVGRHRELAVLLELLRDPVW
jgi:HEAT repeat protein